MADTHSTLPAHISKYPLIPVSDTDLAWLAGFLDGEGCFAIRYQRMTRDGLTPSTVSSVSVSQAMPRADVLFWCQERFGGYVGNHKAKAHSNHNESMHWIACGESALAVARLTLPYLKLKARHAELLLEHQATKILPGERRGLNKHQIKITPERQAIRKLQIDEIRRLNTRGVAIRPDAIVP